MILAPCTPCRALRIGQATMELDGVTVPARPNIGVFTQPISFIGLPVVAVPVRVGSGLPLAVQVIAAPWREDLALRVAGAIEGAAGGAGGGVRPRASQQHRPLEQLRPLEVEHVPPLPCGRGVGGEGDTLLYKPVTVVLADQRSSSTQDRVTLTLPLSHTLQRYRQARHRLERGSRDFSSRP